MAGRSRPPLVAGNWKMNGLCSSLAELDQIIAGARSLAAELMVCPPATLIAAAAARANGSSVVIGAQNCHAKPSGAFTGDISAEMLRDAGARAVIVGHSERRMYHAETDADVRAKTLAARRAGLLAIACVGETKDARERGATLDVVARQLAGSVPDGARAEDLVIAYEPVWAIGTGLTPTARDIAAVHNFVRETMVARFGGDGSNIRILYGGSVNPANAAEILAIDDVDGALVGGASLRATEFLAIAAAGN
jgi:triosephosphate isomerase (TIM)